jgi:rhodanese-related sulfurtransferase
MENNKNEKIALVVGFFLILLVITITLLRSNLFSGSNTSSQTGSQDSQSLAALGYQTINAKDLQSKLIVAGQHGNITALDIRPFDSYAQEHIIDAVNITPSEFPIGAKIDSHNLVVVVGANGTDSDISKTVDELKKEKFSNILVLAGGMDLWKQLVGVTVTYGDPNSFTDQSKVSYVTPEDLSAALKQNVPTFILDVRSAEDYAKGHIAGAKNIPAEELEKRRSEISENRMVVVGINELQEFQASVQLYDMLLASPFVLKGGMPQWEQKGYPETK